MSSSVWIANIGVSRGNYRSEQDFLAVNAPLPPSGSASAEASAERRADASEAYLIAVALAGVGAPPVLMAVTATAS